jgi:hypothetical protein
MSRDLPQIHAEYQSFLEWLKKIAIYAVDLADSEKNGVSNAVTYWFSQDEFFDNLYVPRNQEIEIREELNIVSNFLVLIGARGSGKTTLALKIERDLAPTRSFGYFVAYIDVRTKVYKSHSHTMLETSEANARDVKEPHTDTANLEEAAVSELMEKIKNRYLDELFPDPDPENPQPETRNRRLELIAFLLNSHNGMPETYEFLTNLQFTASRLFMQYKDAMRIERKNHKMYDWLVNTSLNDSRVYDLVQKAHDNLTPSMVVHAAKKLYEFRHQIIWIDNLDILSERNQGLAQQAAKNLYARISQIASVIISVREQNIYRDYDLDEPGAPPVRTEVKLYTGEHERVSARELGQIREDTIPTLLSKRLLFAREIHSRQVNQIAARLAEFQAQLDKVGNDAYERRRLENVVGQLTAELNTLGPKISNERFEHCQRLSSALVGHFQRHRAVYFCNGDIRQILNIHVDCLAYLLSRPKTAKSHRKGIAEITTPMALSYKDSQISTLFLTRLRDRETSDEEHPIGAYDVIRNMNDWYLNNQSTMGCFLEYLVLTATWNLTLSQQGAVARTSALPTIESLIRVLDQLDYTKNEVFGALARLYDSRNRVGFIEIQAPDTSHISDANKIKESDLVHVTPRGKCLVGNLSNTFGYTYACFRRLSLLSKDSWHPAINTTNALQELMPSLCDLAWMHIMALKSIRDKGKLGSRGWLDRYRSLFGIPVLESITRHSLLTTGKIIHPGRRALQFEILIAGIIQHAPPGKPKRDLELLQRAYADALSDLESFRGGGISSFRELLDLSDRSDD